jgi:hypothetical protein
MTNAERAGSISNAASVPESLAVTPRWEWRTFAQHLAPVPQSVAVGPSDASQDEVYFVAAVSPQNVKLRRDRVEIKQLEEIDANGLERWRPVASFAFPLGRAELDRIGAALGVRVPGAPGISLDRAGLLAAVESLYPRVVAIPVTKRRSRFVAAACRGEHVDLLIRNDRWQSIALEDEDPTVVKRAVHLLQMDHFPNTNYPAVLKAIAGVRSVATPSLLQETF